MTFVLTYHIELCTEVSRVFWVAVFFMQSEFHQLGSLILDVLPTNIDLAPLYII